MFTLTPNIKTVSSQKVSIKLVIKLKFKTSQRKLKDKLSISIMACGERPFLFFSFHFFYFFVKPFSMRHKIHMPTGALFFSWAPDNDRAIETHLN
jgi:hypothetical protein